MTSKLLILTTILLMNSSVFASISIVFDYVVFEKQFPLLRSSKIIQDRYGMIWVGTQEEGLFSYNGVSNKQYIPINGDSLSLAFRIINDIVEDEVGNLWLAAKGGVAQYNRKTNTFKNIFIKTSESFMNTLQVINISEEYIIASGPNLTMYLISKKHNLTPVLIKTPESLVDNPSKFYNFSTPIWAKSKTKGWYYFHQNKIYYYNPSSNNFTLSGKLMPNNLNRVPTGIATDENGVFWILYADGSLKLFNPNSNTYTHLIKNEVLSNHDNNLVKNPIFYLGKMFVPTGIKGLITIDTATLKVEEIKLGNQNSTSNSLETMLSSDRVYGLLYDNAGSVWAATYAGIYKYNPSKIRFNKIDRKLQAISEKDLITHVIDFHETDSLNFLVFDARGNMWSFNKKNQNLQCILGNKSEKYINIKSYCAVGIDQNNLLLGSDSAILIFDIKDKRVLQTYKFKKSIDDNLNNKIIDLLYLEKDKYLLACSQGAILFNLKTKNFIYLDIKDLKSDHKYIGVKNFYRDKQGKIWASSLGKGLLYVDIPNLTLIPVLNNLDANEEFFDSKIMSVTKIRDKFILGTWGNGLVEMTIPQKFPQQISGIKKESLTISQLFPSQVVYCALEDHEGYIWSSTNKGLVKFNPSSGYYRTFDLSDGIQGYEFNMNAFLKASDGCMFFGGIGGFNYFNPISVVSNTATAFPRIAELEVFNSQTRESRIIDMLQISEVSLGYRDNNLKINFFYPHYMNPAGNQYMYKLDGLDKNWNYIGNNTSVIFNNLAPSRYTFKVKAANPDGRWSENEASFDLRISYPFWLDWRFYGAALFLSLNTFFIYLAIKNRRERVFKQQLETEIAQKTNDIQKINSSLEQQNQQFKEMAKELELENKSKDVFFSILSHDLRAPLTTLKGLINIYQNKNSGLSKDDLFGHMYKLQGSVDNSLQLIDTILYWYHAQGSNLEVKKKSLLLHELVERSVSVYRAVADKKMVFVKVEIDPMLEVLTDEDMMSVVIRNLVSNAVKFSPKGGKVTIISTVSGEKATLSISDQGGGIPAEVIEMIQKRGQAISSRGTLGEKGTGLGLALAFRFCKASDIDLTIATTNSMGTTICLTFPLVSSH